MQNQSDFPLPTLTLTQSIAAGDAPPEVSSPKSVRRWFAAAFARLLFIAATMALLAVLYVGSYFATAFATGAGWMEVATRQRIVWTVYWPISTCAVNEPLSGPRYINDANGWFFRIGWNYLHE